MESQTTSTPSSNASKSKLKKNSQKSKLVANLEGSDDTPNASTPTNSESADDDQNSDDDDGWITPFNIQQVKAAEFGQAQDDSDRKVGCCTTDFAMQNVIIQMGLTLLSLEGLVMKKIKQWMLRCHACGSTTRDMDKKFCPACGNATLLRVSYKITDNGKTIITGGQIKKTNKGTKYSIPRVKGGRGNNDIILSEHEYLNKLRKQKKEKSIDVFDPDFTFAGSSVTKHSDVVVGYGKKNPNAPRKKFGKTNKSVAH